MDKMEFNPENEVVKLCAEGMAFEGRGEKEEALKLFEKAWNLSETNLEKFTSAHYVARHQDSMEEKLAWDKVALNFALATDGNSFYGVLPSLYLNIGKCYEDLDDFESALSNYANAKLYFDYLPADGYGNMIRAGVESGILRVNK